MFYILWLVRKLLARFFKAMMGLKMKGMVRYPDLAEKINEEYLRYEHRMAPFSCLVTPTFVNYRQFLEMSG